ncbi:MAG TPA: S41 family peptidase [Opitutaceae bacterium]|jgi:carboxyl-terminal processing protease|nr:S41 family peptidase [Opitutaceae bacterium]
MKQMHTVAGMLKRILTIATGIVLGVALTLLAGRLALAWSLFPNRGVERSASYFHDVLKLVNENYVEAKAADPDQLTHAALKGMTASLDPHSEFLTAKDFDELQDEMNGGFGGIGVLIDVIKGKVVVVAPIAGTPGARAGILHGDQILRVEGQSIDGLDMDGVIGLLRGKPKTKVVMSLYRPGTRKNFDVTLTREIIKVDSVRGARLLPDGIGYLQLTEFSDNTADEFDKALDKLLHDGATSLIIDLRDNPGGLLDAAVAVANPFFKKDELIVYTQGRTPESRDEYRAEGDGQPLTLPIAVLINSGSASAAEIVAGALRDTGRAIIVGERSFGKGSVQSIFPLHNGEGLRLTTARYYTPSGVTIHEHGIDPQVEVVLSPDDDEKIRLQSDRDDITDAKTFEERFGFAPIEDRQLQAAIDVLRGVQAFDAHNPPAVAK